MIYAVDVNGGVPEPIAAEQAQPFSLAVHAGYLYWLTGRSQPTQELRRIRL
jgi:hypothetical protein